MPDPAARLLSLLSLLSLLQTPREWPGSELADRLGLRVCTGQPVAGIDESAVRALTQVLPARLRTRVHALDQATLPLRRETSQSVSPDVLTTIAGAAANHERTRLRYAARDGAVRDRHVEPHRLVASGGRWYVVADDLDRADWRTFRVDQVESVRATGWSIAAP